MSSDVEEVFLSEVDAAMLREGWSPANAAPFRGMPAPGRYFHELDGEWVAVAEFDLVERTERLRWGRRRDAWSIEADVGVTCLAAERLADALGATTGNLALSEDAGVAAGEPELSIPVKDTPAIPAAVAAAVWQVRSSALEYARSRANVDAWLAGFAGLDDDEYGNVERFNRRAIPVMLLANGRSDEALEQVARYERSAPDDPGYRTFAQELRAFVSSGAPMPEPSAEAFSYVRSLEKRLEELRSESEALQAGGRDRDIRSIAREARGVATVLGHLVRDRHAGRSNTLAGWSSVALDADTQPILDAAYDHADAMVLDTAFIDVTLTQRGTDLDVFIGDRRVGQISGVRATPGVVRGRLVRKRLPRRVELIVQVPPHEREQG